MRYFYDYEYFTVGCFNTTGYYYPKCLPEKKIK